MYTDAHLHLIDYIETVANVQDSMVKFPHNGCFCFSAHEKTEFIRQSAVLKSLFPSYTELYASSSLKEKQFFFSFGIHPQKPVKNELSFLISLLKEKKIDAVGECGFDLFTDEYQQMLPEQITVWNEQIALAQLFNVPVVIHCRKALPLLFQAVPQLKRVPAVIFHGWSGGMQEAEAFLKKGINAYFSIGKALLRGQKSVSIMAEHFDIRRILVETDSPYMRLKDEVLTNPCDIVHIVRRIALLRGIPTPSTLEQYAFPETYRKFLCSIKANFYTAFTGYDLI